MLKQNVLRIKIWLRCIDDVFAIWSHCKSNRSIFLDHLDGLKPTTNFSIESKKSHSLTHSLHFLDLPVGKSNTMRTNVRRRPTHTWQYLTLPQVTHTVQSKEKSNISRTRQQSDTNVYSLKEGKER